MVLMVVVVVAVGGVFTRLFAYHGEPRLPSDLWKSLWKSLWKNLPEDNDLYTTTDGPAMWKIWLFGMGRPCGKTGKTMGQRKEDGAILFLSFSVVTCTRHDDIYVYILLIYMLLLAAFVAAASCLCRCF